MLMMLMFSKLCMHASMQECIHTCMHVLHAYKCKHASVCLAVIIFVKAMVVRHLLHGFVMIRRSGGACVLPCMHASIHVCFCCMHTRVCMQLGLVTVLLFHCWSGGASPEGGAFDLWQV